MTNQEINERVAKLCGWTIKTNTGLFFDSSDKPHVDLPNYAESLDACREFEEALSKEERYEYGNMFLNIKRFDTLYGGNRIMAFMTVTALERCEAFLRMKGQLE